MRTCFLAVAILANPALAGEGTKDERLDRLPGRWDYAKNDAYYIRLAKNGTFRWVASDAFMEGVYRLLPGGVIEFNLVLPGGRRTNEMKFELESDTLRIKVSGQWLLFKKAAD